MDRVSSVRSSGLTFAPEAGSQRLRDAINKNLSEEDLFRACNVAFEYGKNTVKLYFMNGLPTETDEDIVGISDLASKVVDLYYQSPGRVKGKHITVTVSVACFVPKPCTPFQWEPQDPIDELVRKQRLLRDNIKSRKIQYNWHDAKVSRLEGIFAKGDRRQGKALLMAHEMGVRFDGWMEFFDYDKWMGIFEKCGLDTDFYVNRRASEDEIFPWDVIDCGVSKEFLMREYKKAQNSEPSPNCAEKCSGCGANKLGGVRSCCPKTCG
jgi:radical SAM superfamily enzyme YgiQ (UPF0313 family)